MSRTHTRTARRVGRAVAATGLAALILGSLAARRPASRGVAGLSFRISASTRIYEGDAPRGQDDEVMRGRGVAANNHSRIEFLAFTPAPFGITLDDQLVALDSGHVYLRHASSGNVNPVNQALGGPGIVVLTRMAGGGRGRGAAGGRRSRGGRGGPPGGGRANRGGGGGGGRTRARARAGGGATGLLDQLDLLDVNFKLDKLGVVDTLDGKATQHYRVTTSYRIVWGGQTFPAEAVTDIWTAHLPTDIPNPFESFFVADQSTDGPLIEYALKLRAVRAQIEGTPIKMVSTTTLTGIADVAAFSRYVGNDPENTNPKLSILQQTQITGITAADVDPKEFDVGPTG